MHSHHSHSGDYVAHASDTLETITARAVEMGFDIFCLTEHMPRLDSHYIYPEETERDYTITSLESNFDKFYAHANELQKRRRDEGCKTKFLVGMEVEGIDTAHIEYAKQIREEKVIDMCVGSVHFVRGVAIDMSREMLEETRDLCGGWKELFSEYFDVQWEVLTTLKPEVVGHFDLIRLFMAEKDVDPVTGKTFKELSIEKDWPDIWAKIQRNLEFVRSYGGLIELNSAAIRKSWSTPYPALDVADAVKRYCDGRFCFSDDSHAIAQVGLNYHKVLKYIDEDLKLDNIYYLDIHWDGERKTVSVESLPIVEVKKAKFWDQYPSL
ncbi:Histidinol-phosphatase [Cyberlindnera fabianii]|uniref:Histidinol-phosphatase n=1 Tax=Cyberlindnera fabianii TaxID=36022 RepID=A0A1V2L6F6_CYBFA|nr:Histidinol-phosphatase [Cyberlindnera fabianii]